MAGKRTKQHHRLSPLEFLSLIRDAECVYTTTFHGSIFTFLQHKRCYVDIKSKKVKDLLAWTGMTNQVNRVNCTYDLSSELHLIEDKS